MTLWGLTPEEWEAIAASAQQPAGSSIYQPMPPELTFDVSREEFAAQMAELEKRL